jgi:hypothetical protein
MIHSVQLQFTESVISIKPKSTPVNPQGSKDFCPGSVSFLQKNVDIRKRRATHAAAVPSISVEKQKRKEKSK